MEHEEANQEEEIPEEEKSVVPSEQAALDKVTDEAALSPDEISIEQMPLEMRKSFQAAFTGMISQVSGPRVNPLLEKFTDAHIDKYLDYVQRDDDHEYELKKPTDGFICSMR